MRADGCVETDHATHVPGTRPVEVTIAQAGGSRKVTQSESSDQIPSEAFAQQLAL